VLIVRAGTTLSDAGSTRAVAIASAVRAHPLASHLDATVLIGPGGTGCIVDHDPRPLVVVLLADSRATTSLGAATTARADAVVVAEIGVPRALATAAGDAPVVRVDHPDHATRPFLLGATPEQSRRAWATVRLNQALAQALRAEDAGASALGPTQLAHVADAVAEAVVAAGRGYTRPMERPAG